MNTAPDLTMAAIKMIMALGVVLLAVWGLYRLTKGKLAIHPGGNRRKMIQVMESQYVGVKKSITMVKIPGSVLVLGVGTDSVNLLTQIDDPEVLRDMAAETQNDRRASSFKEHLQRLTKPKVLNHSKVGKDQTVTPS